MNIIITSCIFLVYFCVINAGATDTCAADLTAFPPDPKTKCCGVEAGGSDRLAGGSQTRVDQFPWLALLEYDKNGKVKTPCGGALISSKYVLTAARCVTVSANLVGTLKNIRLGEYDTSNDGPDCQAVESGGEDCTAGVVRIPIEKTIVHPGFQNTNNGPQKDISLIRMAQAAPYTDFIRPICLPSVDMTLRTDAFRLIKAGWVQVSGVNPIKNQVDLPFVRQEDCQKPYSKLRQNISLERGQFCAGGELGKDSCKGDGGMPLVYQNGETFEAIGIVSFGVNPCGRENIPSVYTNIYEYKNWIVSNIKA